MIQYRFILILFVFCLLFQNLYSQSGIEITLNHAGKNRKELEKLIEHYRKVGDREKLQAAQLIVTNMNGLYINDGPIIKKYEPFFLFLDSLHKQGIKIKERTSLQLIKPVEQKWNEVTHTFTPNDYSSIYEIQDATYLSSDLLIKHIDGVFNAWRNNEWSHSYSFNQFCEYILPYKVFNERAEAWMDYFSSKYSKTVATFAHCTNPVTVADSINKEVESWFKFGTLFYKYPFDMGLTRLLQSHFGTCNHMVTTAIYALRSVGVGCAVDHCTQYGNRSLGHTWVAIIDKDNQTVPVNGASMEWLGMGYVFGEQTLNVKLPKVLRKTFTPQSNSLALLKDTKESIYPLFEDSREMDVTAEYMPVSDIKLSIPHSLAQGLKYAYLCVFNNKDWVPVWWGKVVNDSVVFHDMGRDIMYLPMIYSGKELKPIGLPFCLSVDGVIKALSRYKGRAQSVILYNKYPPRLTANNDSTNAILKSDSYELFYWDNKWVSLGEKTTANRQADIDSLGFDFKKKLFFEHTNGREFLFYETVPVGTLFLLHDCSQGKEERIFTIENETQIWW